jgi:hypothetical protein
MGPTQDRPVVFGRPLNFVKPFYPLFKSPQLYIQRLFSTGLGNGLALADRQTQLEGVDEEVYWLLLFSFIHLRKIQAFIIITAKPCWFSCWVHHGLCASFGPS